MTMRGANNKRTLLRDKGALLMSGVGGSDDGDRPFIDRRMLLGDGVEETNAAAERLWRCEEGLYESPIAAVKVSVLFPDSFCQSVFVSVKASSAVLQEELLRQRGRGCVRQVCFNHINKAMLPPEEY